MTKINYRRFSTIFLLCAVAIGSGSTSAQDDMAHLPSTKYHPINILPLDLQVKARQAKPGIVLKKARLSWQTDEGVYIVLGNYYSQKWRIKISPNGTIASVTRDA